MIMKKRTPDFKGEGIAVWANVDKNGKQFLTIKILDAIIVNAFAYDYTAKKQNENVEGAENDDNN